MLAKLCWLEPCFMSQLPKRSHLFLVALHRNAMHHNAWLRGTSLRSKIALNCSTLQIFPVPHSRLETWLSIMTQNQALHIFCFTNLPQARIRWVRSTFSSHCPLSSKQRCCCWLSLASSTIIFSSEKNSGTLGIKRGVAGFGRKYENHFAMLPSLACFTFQQHSDFQLDSYFILIKFKCRAGRRSWYTKIMH